MKILATADTHFLGARHKEALCTFSHIVATGIREDCTLLMHAGDWWEKTPTVKDESGFNQVVGLLQDAAHAFPVLILQGTPSHDVPGSLDILERIETKHRVVVSRHPEMLVLTPNDKGIPTLSHVQEYTDINSDEIAIATMPALTKSWLLVGEALSGGIEATNTLLRDRAREILLGFAAQWKDWPCGKLLVYHGQVTGCEVSSGQRMYGGAIQLAVEDLLLSGADAVVMGDIHKAQEFAQGRARYCGSPYYHDWGESDERKGFYVLERSEQGKWTWHWEESNARRMVTFQVDYCVDLDSETGWDIGEDFDAERARDAEVRFRVTVPESLSGKINLEMLRPWADGNGAHSVAMDVNVIPDERVRSEAITRARTLREKVLAWGEAKGIDIPGEVLAKADWLDGK